MTSRAPSTERLVVVPFANTLRIPGSTQVLCTAGHPELCRNYDDNNRQVLRRLAHWTIAWPRKTLLACDAHMANAMRKAEAKYGIPVTVEDGA